jgi:hypothetical protein
MVLRSEDKRGILMTPMGSGSLVMPTEMGTLEKKQI